MTQYVPNNLRCIDLSEAIAKRWHWQINVGINAELSQCYVQCDRNNLLDLCQWLIYEMEYDFASLIVEETAENWLLRYIFYGEPAIEQVQLYMRLNKAERTIPSISTIIHAADWHEREARDFFGPVYSDVAESALFLLESVGEDVIRTTPRFFYKFRGVEKIAEGQSVGRVLLLAERFSGTSAFAHSLAFCQAVETICQVDVPARAKALRVVFAELERFRHHLAAIAGICNSTALAVATSQASILEEEALRLSCSLTGHRYLFGLNLPGGVSLDLSIGQCEFLSYGVQVLFHKLQRLFNLLRYSSSFLDRLAEVGMVSKEQARSYGLVGPIARASGIARDLRQVLPYAAYADVSFEVPGEEEGDGHAAGRATENPAAALLAPEAPVGPGRPETGGPGAG